MHDATIPSFRAPRGCVYGVALNHRAQRAELAATFQGPPHGAPPRAPVLYIKPRNTWRAAREPVTLPDDVDAVEIGGALAVVIGSDARCVPATRARDVIAGYTIANDVTVPHTSFFRPPLRQKCRDGFCPLGPALVPRDALPSTDALGLRIYVNGELRLEDSTAQLHRSVAELIADITEFMTLREGDVLLTGVPAHPPLARAGDVMAIEFDGIGRLENRLVSAATTRPGLEP